MGLYFRIRDSFESGKFKDIERKLTDSLLGIHVTYCVILIDNALITSNFLLVQSMVHRDGQQAFIKE